MKKYVFILLVSACSLCKGYCNNGNYEIFNLKELLTDQRLEFLAEFPEEQQPYEMMKNWQDKRMKNV